MKRYTDEQKAQAVARVRTGETRRKVASEVGCSENTLKTWLKQTPVTEAEKSIGDRVAEIMEQLQAEQAETVTELIQRLREVIPESKSLKDIATAYGIIIDKMLVTAGKPTSIQGQAIAVGDGSPEELEKTVEELRNRRLMA